MTTVLTTGKGYVVAIETLFHRLKQLSAYKDHSRVPGHGNNEYREHADVYLWLQEQAGGGYFLRLAVGGVVYFKGVLMLKR